MTNEQMHKCAEKLDKAVKRAQKRYEAADAQTKEFACGVAEGRSTMLELLLIEFVKAGWRPKD